MRSSWPRRAGVGVGTVYRGFSDNGVLSAEIDVLARMHGPVFAEARTLALAGFTKVAVEPESGTVVWPGGADLAPDTLYVRARTGA